MVGRISDNKNKTKRLLLINSVCGYGSTGAICSSICSSYIDKGWEARIAYGRAYGKKKNHAEEEYGYRIGTDLDVVAHVAITRLYDLHGYGCKRATKIFLEWMDEYSPDLIWLHNLHGYYIDVFSLFKHIKERQRRQKENGEEVTQVRWTLHDCWSFTASCAHFTYCGCNRWKTGCHDCPQKREYPSSYFLDNSEMNWRVKRAMFTGVENLTIVTPSNWLADLVKQSYLKDYPVEVHRNTVDENIFRPIKSDFKRQYGLEDKIVLLGVSGVWNEKKGYNDFIKLRRMLDDRYCIVMVGVSDKQAKGLQRENEKHSRGEYKKKATILPITHTEDQYQLRDIYCGADWFLNLTYEDTYPTVNLEAKACGTRIITYNTGGSPEAAGDNAIVIKRGDLDIVKAALSGK